MTAFWLVGAALAVAALLVVLRPLVFRRDGDPVSRTQVNVSIYRDQLRELEADRAAGKLAAEDYERARTEIEARLLEDVAVPPAPPRAAPRALTLAIAFTLPLGAAALYLAVGNPGAVLSLDDHHAMTVQQLDGLVARLAAHLRENPDDVEGLKLLGRSYAALGRYEESAATYARAVMRAPRDAQLLADFADVLAMTRGQSLEGEPEKLVLRALEIDPQNLKALALAGSAAFARRDFKRAVALWERMVPLVAPDSEDARSIRASIDEAKSLVDARPLRGTVTLSAKVKAQASPDDTVFVFARAAEGPPMPLAVKRARVRDLPLEFALDDSMAMAPGLRLSGFAQVVVGARVSKSGTPTPQPGDLQGMSKPVANDARGVSVVIDSVVR